MRVYDGWDIGGVHLKRSRLVCGGGRPSLQTRIVPFEIWKDPSGLARRLRDLLGKDEEVEGGAASGRLGPPAIGGGLRRGRTMHGVTMTAELSDVFASRAEGAQSVLRACAEALPGPPRVLDRNGDLLPFGVALERPLDVAAANWAATSWLVARLRPDALLVDVGSTTTDI